MAEEAGCEDGGRGDSGCNTLEGPGSEALKLAASEEAT